MSQQLDYQIILQEVLKTAREAAEKVSDTGAPFDLGLKAAYYDILDVAKTQAEIMEVPLEELGLEGVEIGDYVESKAA